MNYREGLLDELRALNTQIPHLENELEKAKQRQHLLVTELEREGDCPVFGAARADAADHVFGTGRGKHHIFGIERLSRLAKRA